VLDYDQPEMEDLSWTKHCKESIEDFFSFLVLKISDKNLNMCVCVCVCVSALEIQTNGPISMKVENHDPGMVFVYV
jgi:hypothetical protein